MVGMMEDIEINQHQAKAFSNNADMLLLPIDSKAIQSSDIHKTVGVEKSILPFLPLQEGDEVYFQEEFRNNEYGDIEYKASKFTTPVASHLNANQWEPASEMTYEQSRFKGTVVSVEVKRVQELTDDYISRTNSDYCNDCGGLDYCNNFNENKVCGMADGFKDWLNSQHGKGFYEKSPYIALVKLKMKDK